MEGLLVKKGKIIIYRLFDAATDIDLTVVEQTVKSGAKRLSFTRRPYMKALQFTNPPVSLEMQSFNKSVFNSDARVSVIAKAYDFGVVSIAFEIPIPAGTSFTLLQEATRALSQDAEVDSISRAYALQLMDMISSAISNPEIKEGFIEDYMVVYAEELSGGLPMSDPAVRSMLSSLLTYETRELSPSSREDTLTHSFSYYADDLIILHIDNAFICEPSGSSDLPDILEFANAQILEMRYYDHLMDRELKRIYAEVSGAVRWPLFGIRKYERFAKKMMRTVTEMTEVTEKVNNSLKVTEDIYYARVYRAFMALMRSKDWETSIKEKIQIVMNTLGMIHEEISSRRGYLLELGIFILIILELLVVFYQEW